MNDSDAVPIIRDLTPDEAEKIAEKLRISYRRTQPTDDEKNLLIGKFVWRRGKRESRRRYRAYRVSRRGCLVMTNAELRFQKHRNRWVILIDGVPMNDGYAHLQAAKASISPSILYRLAAESS